LLEMALLSEGEKRIIAGLKDLFHQLDTNPAFGILPLTSEVARGLVPVIE
jgi:hypothetical protein